MIITDEMVEKAVKAARGAVYLQGGLKLSRKYADAFARAALEAVIPSLIEAIERKPETCADARCASYAAGFNNAVEECAKVAVGIYSGSTDYAQGCQDAAAIIRSLIPSKEK